jgi:hypothetical protein
MRPSCHCGGIRSAERYSEIRCACGCGYRLVLHIILHIGLHDVNVGVDIHDVNVGVDIYAYMVWMRLDSYLLPVYAVRPPDNTAGVTLACSAWLRNRIPFPVGARSHLCALVAYASTPSACI